MKYNEYALYFVQATCEGSRYPLYELAKWKNGLAFRNIEFSKGGRPIIKIAELNHGITETTAYTENTYSDEVFLRRGDMLFSWSGNPQTSIDVYWYDLPDGWLNQHIFKVTPNEKLVDKVFLYYLLKFLKPRFTKIAMNKQTTGLGHVTIEDLKRMSVVVPPITEQKRMASILSTIDDKIAMNRAINDNLAA